MDKVQSYEIIYRLRKGEAQQKRDRLPELFSVLGPNPTHQDIVQMNRALNPITD
jgi:hypothetical protein